MGRRSRAVVGRALLGLVALTVAASTARAQHQGHGAMSPATVTTQGTAAPRKVTMEELHRQGGVPRGWKRFRARASHREAATRGTSVPT